MNPMPNFLVALLFLIVASATDSFLQEFEAKTSLGTLGEGVNLINNDVSEISSSLNDSFSVLNDQVETSVELLDYLGTALIETQLDSLNSQLWDLESEISDLESELTTLKACGDYASCSGCATDSGCVWCSTLEICVAGTANGPSNQECADFEFGECSITGCDIYSQCQTCIGDSRCSWCENGKYCGEPDSACEAEFRFELDGNTACPPVKEQISDSDTFILTTNTPKSAKDIEVELKTLYDSRNNLTDVIDSLESKLIKIQADSVKAVAGDLQVQIVDNDNKSLGQTIDAIVERETKESQEFQRNLANETSEFVIGEIVENTNKQTEKISEKVEKSYNQLEGDMNGMKEKLESQVNTMKTELKGVSDQVDAQAKAAQKAAEEKAAEEKAAAEKAKSGNTS